MDTRQQMELFLNGAPHAVVGASHARHKYGNKVLRAFLQANRPAYPVNPQATVVEGVPAFARLEDIPGAVYGISIVTPRELTLQVVAEAVQLGIRHIWMQPGGSERCHREGARHGANVIAGGPCLFVALQVSGHSHV